LNQQELGEKLSNLIELNCSIRGIAEELNKPPTTIRRQMDLVQPSRNRRDSRTAKGRTFAQEPSKQVTMSAIEASQASKAMFQRNRALGLGIVKTEAGKEPQHALKAQSTTRVATPASITSQEPPACNEGLGRKESRTQEGGPTLTPIEKYNLAQSNMAERIGRLESLPDQIPPRPRWDARSMQRQGKPSPAKDRN
jgi:hypothetical protein